jgi:hypothetical protein
MRDWQPSPAQRTSAQVGVEVGKINDHSRTIYGYTEIADHDTTNRYAKHN